VRILAEFADRHGITYPLLSDEGSHTIRAIGLYNQHLAEQHAIYGVQVREHQFGVAYPGIFVLNEEGTVIAKQFEQSYRVRPAPAVVVEDVLGMAGERPAVAATADREGVHVTAWLGSRTYRPYQKLRLHVTLQMADGVHIYGKPAPEGSTPLEVAIEPLEGLSAGEPELPAPQPAHLEGIDETFWAYKERVDVAIPFAILSNQGTVTLRVQVRFQACTESVCYPPQDLALEIPLEGLDLIRD
jgi:hypothetical protein